MAEQCKFSLPLPPVPSPACRWALFLDVDGTLLDFVSDPAAVKVTADLIALLTQLHARLQGALALLSGRTIATLDLLFAPLQLPCAGLHGFERRDAQGQLMHPVIAPQVLDDLHGAAHEIRALFPGVLVENKHHAMAFHFGAILQQQAELYKAVKEAALKLNFELLPGRHVYELKPSCADKGSALNAFLTEQPFVGRVPVFVGDDFTDEYALRAAHAVNGMAIAVGDRAVEAAQFKLTNPKAVIQWLQQWKQTLD
jgi:trehalose 6-phosphate phosphatase